MSLLFACVTNIYIYIFIFPTFPKPCVLICVRLKIIELVVYNLNTNLKDLRLKTFGEVSLLACLPLIFVGQGTEI